NWFYAILTMSTMMEMLREREAEEAGEGPIERQPPFHNLLGHALVADENGNEMHKSDGTAIWFEEAAEQLGVDTMRWMYCSQRPIEDLKFGLRNPKKEVTVTGPDGQPMTHTVDGVRLCEVTSTPARETRRRVLMTLWNCYSFFANYAALDGFDPASPAVPMDERSDFDRWIISELHLLIGHVRNGVESFELAAGAYAVEQFIDDLSNWYIRLNRPRFWSKRGAGDAAAERDKLAAYQTLHTVLLTLTKLMAPMVPFVTEKMYQNLARSNDDTAPASVHHCEFPEVNRELIDDELSEEMSAVMLLVQLGRQVRTNEKINTRQPLAAVEVVSKDPTARAGANRFREQILAELNVKQLIVREEPAAEGAAITPNLKALARFGKETKAAAEVVGLLAGDVAAPKLLAGEEIPVLIGDNMKAITLADVYIAPAGFVPTADAVATVSLDVRLNDELRREGLAREVVRALQDLRKKIGLEIEDRIVLRVDDSEPELAAVFDAHLESIAADLLATSAQRKLGSGDVHTVEVRKKPALSLKAQIEKA
ncbi:MAG: class I tRNA ligase family protein, partial [Planctomycetota bacterium]